MRQEQTDEFFAGVTRRTDYGYLLGVHHKKTPPDLTSGAGKYPVRLTFAVLEAFARARLAVLLALLHARVAGQEAFGLQHGPHVDVHREQRAGDAMAHRTSLAGRPAAGDGDLRVELVGRAGDSERLGNNSAQRFHWEIVL